MSVRKNTADSNRSIAVVDGLPRRRWFDMGREPIRSTFRCMRQTYTEKFAQQSSFSSDYATRGMDETMQHMAMHVATALRLASADDSGTLDVSPERLQLLTAEQVKNRFEQDGLAISEWARANGFNPVLVRMVIAGRRKCLRGQSHKIAVALGMKRGSTKTSASDPR